MPEITSVAAEPNVSWRPMGPMSQGAEVPVMLALLGADGPTGAFRGHDNGSIEQTVPW